MLAGWTGTRDAAGLSGSFILVNSIAGLAGPSDRRRSTLPPALPLWIGSVAAGGLIGSGRASRYSILGLRRALAFVLVLAAAKLVFLP